MENERRSERVDPDVTEDAVLGGRLCLAQPKRGHRVGHDAILLAAACPARAGERAVDLGAGVGAAGLALAARVDGVEVTLVEIDARLAALASENVSCNRLGGRVSVVVLDVAAPARAFATAGLAPGSAACVLMNPPFNDPARHRPSPDRRRRSAHVASGGGGTALAHVPEKWKPVFRKGHAPINESLVAWAASAARLLRPRGTLSMIWRADGLADVLRALDPAFGAVTVLPVHAKAGEAAIRVLVRATKESRAPLALLPGFVLNDGSGRPTAQAEAVLRAAAALPLGEI
jgi:tRNA1(Val) A37 N6-methylase TrmN6